MEIFGLIETDRRPPTAVRRIDYLQLASEIPQACGTLPDSQLFREQHCIDRV